MYTIVDPVAGVRGEACSSLPGDPPEVMLASELRDGGVG